MCFCPPACQMYILKSGLSKRFRRTRDLAGKKKNVSRRGHRGLTPEKARLGRNHPRPIDAIYFVSSDSSSTPDATTARLYETIATRVTPSQATRRSGASRLTETPPRSKRRRLPGGGLKVGREKHCSLCSECTSRHCGACFSEEVRDAGRQLY